MIKFRKLSTCFFRLFESVGKMQLGQAVVNEEQPVVKKNRPQLCHLPCGGVENLLYFVRTKQG